MSTPKLPFTIRRSINLGWATSAWLDEGEVLTDALAREVVSTLSTELEIKIGTTEMHLAAWMDPDHWASDWAEKLDIDIDDVHDAVEAILADAVTTE